MYQVADATASKTIRLNQICHKKVRHAWKLKLTNVFMGYII